MGYIIWKIEDDEPRILDIKFQLLLLPKMCKSGTYSEFAQLIGKKAAQAALKRYILERRKAFQQRISRWTSYPQAESQ